MRIRLAFGRFGGGARRQSRGRQPDRALGHAGRRPHRARHQGVPAARRRRRGGRRNAGAGRAAHPGISAPSRPRGHGRRLPQPRLRDARPRRRARRGAAALQAARPPLRRRRRGQRDGAAAPAVVARAQPAARPAVHRAPVRLSGGARAARDRALRDRLRIRAARRVGRGHDPRRLRARPGAQRRAPGAAATALAAAAGRRRRQGLAARPPGQDAGAGGRGLARGRRERGHRAQAVRAGHRRLARRCRPAAPMQPNRSSWQGGNCPSCSRSRSPKIRTVHRPS